MKPPLVGTAAKARARLLVRAPFFGSLALDLHWVAAPGVGPMATDGRHLWYDPAWCDARGAERTLATIATAVLRVANRHHLRMGGRDPRLWNLASSLVVGRVLLAEGYAPPDGLPLDRAGRFAGLPVEAVYERLRDEAERDGGEARVEDVSKDAGGGGPERPAAGGGGNDDAGDFGRAPGEDGTDARDGPADGDAPGDGPETDAGAGAADPGDVPPAEVPGEVRPMRAPGGRAMTPAQTRRAEADLDVRLRQAAAMARRVGLYPAALREMAEAAADREDWRDRLRLVFDGTLRGEPSWSRPNRRFVAHGLCLPGWARSGAGTVVFAVDTSGSIGGRELSAYVGNAAAVLEETGPTELILVQCDAAVQKVDRFRPGETIDRIEVQGRGGTRFQPVFDWVAENAPDARAVIYATDLACFDRPADPGIPVIWLTPTRGGAMPFGEVVHVTP